MSHETIHRSLFLQARRVLKQELIDHLRCKRRMRHWPLSRTATDSHGQIADAVSIRKGPREWRTTPSLVIGKAIS